jgi:hypothetical protein
MDLRANGSIHQPTSPHKQATMPCARSNDDVGVVGKSPMGQPLLGAGSSKPPPAQMEGSRNDPIDQWTKHPTSKSVSHPVFQSRSFQRACCCVHHQKEEEAPLESKKRAAEKRSFELLCRKSVGEQECVLVWGFPLSFFFLGGQCFHRCIRAPLPDPIKERWI